MTFESKLMFFWVGVGALAIYLCMRPASSVAKAALSWLGPLPLVGEHWARYQWRWTLYSLSWLVQILFAMTLIFVFFMRDKSAYEQHTWLQVAWFALPLGAGAAILASLGFLFKAAKAKLIGPNPIFAPKAQPGVQADVAEKTGNAA